MVGVVTVTYRIVTYSVSNNSNFFLKIGLKSSPKNVQKLVAEYGN